jgi:hypothetical protein
MQKSQLKHTLFSILLIAYVGAGLLGQSGFLNLLFNINAIHLIEKAKPAQLPTSQPQWTPYKYYPLFVKQTIQLIAVVETTENFYYELPTLSKMFIELSFYEYYVIRYYSTRAPPSFYQA